MAAAFRSLCKPRRSSSPPTSASTAQRPQRINLPPKSSIQGLYQGFLVATLQEAWRGHPQGALIAYPLSETGSENPTVTVLFAPNARQSIEGVSITHDAIIVAGYENVRGRIATHRAQRQHLGHHHDRASGKWLSHDGWLIANREPSLRGIRRFPDAGHALRARPERARPRARSVRCRHSSTRRRTSQSNIEAVSADGTRVPYFVLRRRDMPFNGENPTLLYAYGGFQVSYTPTYSPNVGKLWLDRGGVYVLANIRGGGEFGPAWHQAGLRTHRQVIYDDFYAVERDLVERRITTPRRLGIMGGSNGGLLMGVMLNQHPEMINAAVVQVPLLDMLRYDQLLAGASWVDEYGSPSNPEERAFLETITPVSEPAPPR